MGWSYLDVELLIITFDRWTTMVKLRHVDAIISIAHIALVVSHFEVHSRCHGGLGDYYFFSLGVAGHPSRLS